MFPFQDPEKEVSDWLSDLTLVGQHPDLEVLVRFCFRYFYRRLKTEMFTWYCVESLQ